MRTKKSDPGASRHLKFAAAGLLLTLVGTAQALDVYDWYPPFGTVTGYMGLPGNWGRVVQVPCGGCPGGFFDAPEVATALGPTVRGQMHGFMIDSYRFLDTSLNMAAVVNSDIVLGSLHVLSGAQLAGGPAYRIIERAAGSTATLTLAGESGVPLVVGSAGGGAAGSSYSHVSFNDLLLVSQGSALVHSDGWLDLRGQTLWTHDGEVVLGASAAANGVRAVREASLGILGGSLVPTLGGRLEIIAGSVSRGIMAVNSATAPALVEAHFLTLGGEQAAGVLLVEGNQSRVRVLEDLRVDRGAGGDAVVRDGANLQANVGQIGFLPSAVGGTLRLESGARADFVKRTVQAGFFTYQVGGTLDVGTDPVGGGTGMKGLLTSEAGTTLVVEDRFAVGGSGSGAANLDGELTAGNIQIGSSYGAGAGSLQTRGGVSVGDPTATFSGDSVSLQGRAEWLHGGQGSVYGSVSLGTQGGEVGQTQLLRIDPGGVLNVTGAVEVGSYRDGNVIPRLEVQPGASLTVGLANPPFPAFGATVTIESNGHWMHAGDGQVYGDVAIGASSFGSTTPGLTVAAGGLLHVSGRVVAGPAFGATPSGNLRAEVRVDQGGTLRTDGGVVLNTDTRLVGNGTVEGDVEVNGGAVAPGQSPGHLTITGNLSFGDLAGFEPGVMIIELGNASAPGLSYDVLDVAGTLALGDSAILEIQLLPGFDAGGSYEFLHFGSLTALAGGGEAWFAQVTVLDAGGGNPEGLNFERDGGRFGIHLGPTHAVPEPASALLMLMGAMFLLAVRRARRNEASGAAG